MIIGRDSRVTLLACLIPAVCLCVGCTAIGGIVAAATCDGKASCVAEKVGDGLEADGAVFGPAIARAAAKRRSAKAKGVVQGRARPPEPPPPPPPPLRPPVSPFLCAHLDKPGEEGFHALDLGEACRKCAKAAERRDANSSLRPPLACWCRGRGAPMPSSSCPEPA